MNHLPWEPNPSDRLMILAPHPDDEVLAGGGVLAKAVESGNQSSIRVIIATNGDASYATSFTHGSHIPSRKNFQRQSTLRQKESLNALTTLGLEAARIHFWGFPDRGLAALWKDNWDSGFPYRSPTTNYKSSVQSVNSPVLSYTKANMAKLFENELLDFCPNTIIMPSPYDNHSDHSALAGFTLLAVKRYTQSHHVHPILLTYWMWRQLKPWLTGETPLDLASFHPEADSAIQPDLQLKLNPEIRARKLRALQCYPSQKIAAGKIFHEVSRRLDETFTPLQLRL